jgi:Flp pilus assembly protein CpaB
MQKSNQTAIVGVIIFGILAVGLTFYALTRGSGPSPNANQTSATADTSATPKSYFVASRQIWPRTRITRDMLMERQSNGHPIPANAITDPFQVVGKLANGIMQPGQVFTTEATVQPVTRVIPANIPIPTGLRAVAVWVNPKETAAGLVDVGDRVDVISTNQLKGKTATSDSVEFTSGRTIAQDLQVLAVDKSINAPTANGAQPAPAAAPAGGNNQQPENSDASRTRVILAATPQQVQRIAAANAAGTLHIAIRNPGDSMVLPTGESLEYPVHLISTKTAPAASPAPAAPPVYNRNNQSGPYFPPPSPSLPPAVTTVTSPINEVTVIRGTEKTVVAVPK